MDKIASAKATRNSFERFLAVEPQLDGCAPVASLTALPERTLLHAGPPFNEDEAIPPPVLNSAAAAACFEGWADSHQAARAAIARGSIRLEPAQDYAVVTPLAFVVSPSMWALRVSDAGGAGPARLSPLNDGPLPSALRFGAVEQGQAGRLALLRRIGPAFGAALRDPVPVLPVMQDGLAGGDDLHGRVSAANAALVARLAPRLAGEARDYLSAANQFVLNVLMAACAAMIGGGTTGTDGSTMVTAAGANGIRFGWKVAGRPNVWQTMAASVPVGPRFANAGARAFLPAIGDSAVIDACGFGAAALRYAPEMIEALRGHVAEVYFTPAASEPFLGCHPAFPSDLKLGLDIGSAAPVRGVMLAAIDAAGETGLIGRGVAPWPISA